MRKLNYTFDVHTDECFDECPYWAAVRIGRDTPAMIGSYYCREECPFAGHTPDDGRPIICNYPE